MLLRLQSQKRKGPVLSNHCRPRKGNGMKYNENITIVEQDGDLEENQWFALMVMDLDEWKDRTDMFDKNRHWVGLECTSGKRVYISKKREKRESLTSFRGEMVVVEVKDPNLCLKLA